ncbi:MAG: phosphatidylserine decarboxylase [Lachnospiraceae bacterium]|nr:phosphatidylserine decarboxylase [Lachnospiraceae bacterium]
MDNKRFETYDMNKKDSFGIVFLYKFLPGRLLLQLLIRPANSKIVGRIMDSGFTKLFIPRFIKNHNIDLSDYKDVKYKSFNDFFVREVKDGTRPVSFEPHDVIAPCDGKLTAYRITQDSIFEIKNSVYDLKTILKDKKLADDFIDGLCLIFRLMPNDYHRYCFIDNGEVISRKKIRGVLHTVRPIALRKHRIYKKNAREYAVLKTENFDTIVQMEVGALFVGRIKNDLSIKSFKRGDEKGMFEFGGSTIVMLFKQDAVKIEEVIFANTEINVETVVKMGTVIGCSGNRPAAP